MAGRALRDLVDEFVLLVRKGSGSQEQNEAALERLLDELALAQHDVSFAYDDADYPDAPDWPYEERRNAVCQRFPNYGLYNVAMPVSKEVGEAKLVVGDAIDDIADIAGELSAVAWCWRNTSEADALWHFDHSFRSHWGKHLRELQLYLHSLRNGR